MKNALILLNMGGPNNLNEVEVFLRNMFNDKYILTTRSSMLRKLIARIIVKARTKKSQAMYAQIGGKSPLVDITNELIKELETLIPNTLILPVMRYTPPFAHDAIETLKQNEGLEHITLLPMYPHYSSTTSQSSIEDIKKALREANITKPLTVIDHYFENHSLNRAIIDDIKQKCEAANTSEIDLVFSAHGLPQSIIDNGDVYQEHIEAHVQILSDMLKTKGIAFNSINLAYQSKVGPMKWLEPSLQQMLEQKSSNKKVLIYPIAFTIDNSETIYELVKEYKDEALKLGYVYYEVVPALNSSTQFARSIKEITRL